ncbi:hypothetical protein DFJ74DRAFT_773759 [Hyaloraphidium curvatum]|nr:hypothetical protein DFJ74DRAFT_773759 [Hyaloraphidium curvatum]
MAVLEDVPATSALFPCPAFAPVILVRRSPVPEIAGLGAPSDPAEMLALLRAELALRGLDICVAFRTGWYLSSCPPELRAGCDPFCRGGAGLAVLVGNTRALWQPFTSFLAAHPLWRSREDPLDDYVSLAVSDALAASLPPGVATDAHFAHETSPGRLVAMQLLGEACGLAHRHLPSGLSLHPEYGPWFAYRAAIFLDLPWPGGPEDPAPPAPPDPVPEECREEARAAADEAWATVRSPDGPPPSPAEYGRPFDWRAWLRLRELLGLLVPDAAAHAYTEPQALYHYTRDRIALRQSCSWADVDVLVIVAETPCARCGAADALAVLGAGKLGVPGPEPGSEGLRVRVRQTAWCSTLARGMVGGAVAGIGTAREVCAALGGGEGVDWDAVGRAAAREDEEEMDRLLAPAERRAKEGVG